MRSRIIAALLILIGLTSFAVAIYLDQGSFILEILNTMSQAGTAGMS